MSSTEKEQRASGGAATITPEEDADVRLYGHLYKSLRMGAESILSLLPKVKDEKLRSAMTVQLAGYDKFSEHAGSVLDKANIRPKEENLVTRLSAKMGMVMNTMADSTSSHIAEMMIEGSTMGMTDAQKQVSEYEKQNASAGALRFAKEIVSFEEGNIETLKKFL